MCTLGCLSNLSCVGDRAVLGMVAGGVAQWASSPADLIKVRMQMEGRRRLQVEEERVLQQSQLPAL